MLDVGCWMLDVRILHNGYICVASVQQRHVPPVNTMMARFYSKEGIEPLTRLASIVLHVHLQPPHSASFDRLARALATSTRLASIVLHVHLQPPHSAIIVLARTCTYDPPIYPADPTAHHHLNVEQHRRHMVRALDVNNGQHADRTRWCTLPPPPP
jgi:hypothetical protein